VPRLVAVQGLGFPNARSLHERLFCAMGSICRKQLQDLSRESKVEHISHSLCLLRDCYVRQQEFAVTRVRLTNRVLTQTCALRRGDTLVKQAKEASGDYSLLFFFSVNQRYCC
jgi:hypothetical protein